MLVLCTAAHDHGTHTGFITPCANLGACFLLHRWCTFLLHGVCSVSSAGSCPKKYHSCFLLCRDGYMWAYLCCGGCMRFRAQCERDAMQRCTDHASECVCLVRRAYCRAFSAWHVSVTLAVASIHVAFACQSRLHISRLMHVCDMRLSPPVVLCPYMQAWV